MVINMANRCDICGFDSSGKPVTISDIRNRAYGTEYKLGLEELSVSKVAVVTGHVYLVPDKATNKLMVVSEYTGPTDRHFIHGDADSLEDGLAMALCIRNKDAEVWEDKAKDVERGLTVF